MSTPNASWPQRVAEVEAAIGDLLAKFEEDNNVKVLALTVQRADMTPPFSYQSPGYSLIAVRIQDMVRRS